MAEIHIHLAETTIDGPGSSRRVVEAGECPELAAHRIARLGMDIATAPYRRVRMRPGGSFVMACLGGEGRVLLEGRWQRVTEGMVCMAPPRVVNAFYAVKGRPWRIGWVRYDEPAPVAPLVGAESPVRIREGATEFGRALEGLLAEWAASRDPKLIHHWVGLVQGMVRRMVQPWQVHDRVWKLWEEVGRRLVEPWDLDALAAACHMSGEHLRRLCQRELGRSPMQHLAFIRIQRAKQMLESTDEKMEAVAQDVGYENGLAFSRAFKRVVGMSPSEYRAGR
jgi:AraC-like DNA-binding protein